MKPAIQQARVVSEENRAQLRCSNGGLEERSSAPSRRPTESDGRVTKPDLLARHHGAIGGVGHPTPRHTNTPRLSKYRQAADSLAELDLGEVVPLDQRPPRAPKGPRMGHR